VYKPYYWVHATTGIITKAPSVLFWHKQGPKTDWPIAESMGQFYSNYLHRYLVLVRQFDPSFECAGSTCTTRYQLWPSSSFRSSSSRNKSTMGCNSVLALTIDRRFGCLIVLNLLYRFMYVAQVVSLLVTYHQPLHVGRIVIVRKFLAPLVA
jgi:hypothetical protein